MVSEETKRRIDTRTETHLSMSESLMLMAMAEGCAVSPSLKTLSMTDSSVLVVSRPQKAHQSLTTIPAAITSLPRFTVPAWTPQRLSIANTLTQLIKTTAASSFMLTLTESSQLLLVALC